MWHGTRNEDFILDPMFELFILTISIAIGTGVGVFVGGLLLDKYKDYQTEMMKQQEEWLQKARETNE